jgi:hypothetical protein
MQAVLIDGSSGKTRVVNTARLLLEVRYHDRWVLLAHWAYCTPELFACPCPEAGQQNVIG